MIRAEICENLRNLWILILLLLSSGAVAQTLQPSSSPSVTPAPEEETIIPTFETQKLARTYILDIPAPRGQITDRHGVPGSPSIAPPSRPRNFPTPLDFSHTQALSFTHEMTCKGSPDSERNHATLQKAILRHYRNRGI